MSSYSNFLVRVLGLCFLAFFLTHCTTETGGTGGSGVDTLAQPQPTNVRPTDEQGRPLAMLSPLAYEYFDFYSRDRELPFNAAYIAALKIERMQIQETSAETIVPESELGGDEALPFPASGREINFEFDADGKLLHFKRVSLLTGSRVDSVLIAYNYAGEDGKLISMDIEELQGTSTAELFEDDKGTGWRDPNGMSYFEWLDPARNWTYVTYFNSAASGRVEVYGPEGSFPDTLATELQSEIVQRGSPFVRYDLLANFTDVQLIEQDANGHPVREVEFERLGKIKMTSAYRYDGAGRPLEREAKEPGFEPRSTVTTWIYENGDLLEVRFEEKEEGAPDNFKAQHIFGYGSKGELTTTTHSKSRGPGSPDPDRSTRVSLEFRN